MSWGKFSILFVKEFKGKLDKGQMRRLPTLAMVGGRCYGHPQGGVVELFSSEVYSFVLEELGWRRFWDGVASKGH